jgi:hypothetical protein
MQFRARPEVIYKSNQSREYRYIADALIKRLAKFCAASSKSTLTKRVLIYFERIKQDSLSLPLLPALPVRLAQKFDFLNTFDKTNLHQKTAIYFVNKRMLIYRLFL